jgi:3'(2'), 5'-bisphosphate nucleotidase
MIENRSELNDHALARVLAQGAGALLAALRNSGDHAGKALGDVADHDANKWLLRELAHARPHDAILSEESTDDLARLNAARVWIIDPLDGTREYREGRDDWAVHVALVADGRAIAAAVAMPSRSEVFATDDVVATKISQRRIVISRSRPPAFAPRVAHALDAELLQVGSAGAKAMMVVRGESIAYIHEGGMNEWDAAAPAGVALAHGLHVSTLKGEPIRFNQRDVVLHDGLIICAKEVAQKIIENLQE